MAKAKKTSDILSVDDYMKTLDHPLTETVEALRRIILGADNEVGEQIKWNSPSFYYTGEMQPFDPKEYKRDIVVFNLNKKEYILLVFPTGARVNDTTGILEGKYPDGRKMVKIAGMADAKTKKQALQEVVRVWLKGVDK